MQNESIKIAIENWLKKTNALESIVCPQHDLQVVSYFFSANVSSLFFVSTDGLAVVVGLINTGCSKSIFN